MHFAGFFNTLILLGALQGFIVSALLMASARRRPAERVSRRLLALLIFLPALACLNLYLSELPAFVSSWQWNMASAILPLVVIMPMGPLVYFYVRSCGEQAFRLSRKYRPHFYPVVIDLFQHVASLFFVIALLTRLIPNNSYRFGVFLDYYDQYADIPRWLSLTIYLVLSTRYLKGRDQRSSWPRNFVRVFWAFAILWAVFLIPYELPRYTNALLDRLDWYPLYLPLVVMIYWLGFKGYFISFRAETTVAGEKKTAVKPPIADEKAGLVILALKKSMEEEKLWLNPDLNLGMLAQHIGAAPKLLSLVLNQHMHLAFNEFVNSYRVNAVRERMLQPDSREFTIAGLAYDCGFNSLPTFQRAFKSVTGMSPKEYLAKQVQAVEDGAQQNEPAGANGR